MPPRTKSASKRVMPVIGRDDSMADTKTSTTSANGTTARAGFLDLSAELRNKIYHLALAVDKPNIVTRMRLANERDANSRGRGYLAHPQQFNWSEYVGGWTCVRVSLGVAILATCRQIHREATPILYGANAFTTGLGEIPVPLRYFPRSSRQHIRHLRLELGYLDDVEDPMGDTAKLVRFLPNLKKLTFIVGFLIEKWKGVRLSDGEDSMYSLSEPPEWTPEWLAQNSLPFFKSIKKACKMNVEAILAMIDFVPGSMERPFDELVARRGQGVEYTNRFKKQAMQLLEENSSEH